MPVVDLRTGAAGHQVLVGPAHRVASKRDVASATRSLVSYLEGIVREYPGQLDWNWFVIRCQEARGEIEPYVEGAQATRPHR